MEFPKQRLDVAADAGQAQLHLIRNRLILKTQAKQPADGFLFGGQFHSLASGRLNATGVGRL